MEDFFDKFKDNLENRPLPGFKEQDWKDLQQKLDRQSRSKKRAVALWLWLPLLSLLLGSNGYWAYKFSNQTNKAPQLIIKSDTIWKKSVVYHTDTIYRTQVIKEQTANRATTNTSSVLNQNHQLSFQSSKWSTFGETLFNEKTLPQKSFDYDILGSPTPNLTYSTLITPGLSITAHRLNNQVDDNEDYWGISPILSIKNSVILDNHTKLPASSILELKVQEQKKHKKSFAQQLNQLRPIGFMGGVSVGITHLYNDLDVNHPSWSAGIHGLVIYSANLRMWLEANYTQNQFDAYRMDESIGIPIVFPPSDDFAFTKAETQIPAFLMSGGIEYLFIPQKKWSPYFSMGYGVAFTQPYEVTYDFENRAASIEWNFEKRVNQSKTIADFLIVRAGVENQINKHWRGRLGLHYQTNWEDRGQQWQNLFQLQGSLLYQF